MSEMISATPTAVQQQQQLQQQSKTPTLNTDDEAYSSIMDTFDRINERTIEYYRTMKDRSKMVDNYAAYCHATEKCYAAHLRSVENELSGPASAADSASRCRAVASSRARLLSALGHLVKSSAEIDQIVSSSSSGSSSSGGGGTHKPK